jgi:hypothetical protein
MEMLVAGHGGRIDVKEVVRCFEGLLAWCCRSFVDMEKYKVVRVLNSGSFGMKPSSCASFGQRSCYSQARLYWLAANRRVLYT